MRLLRMRLLRLLRLQMRRLMRRRNRGRVMLLCGPAVRLELMGGRIRPAARRTCR